jgi:hypothetical protein
VDTVEFQVEQLPDAQPARPLEEQRIGSESELRRFESVAETPVEDMEV